MLLKKTLDLFGWHLNVLFRAVPERKVLHFGMGNRCNDGKYVLFLDYDHLPLEWVEEEILLLQDLGLGNAYVFKTKHGIHVVFLEKYYLGLMSNLLDVTSADKNYKSIPMQYARKIWILRQSNKKDESIEYLGVRKKRGLPEKSLAHASYLYAFMKVPLIDIELSLGDWDKETDVTMGYYKIAERNN